MKYYIAVYQKLKEIFATQSSGNNEVTLLCPSLRLYAKEDLSLLKPQSLLTDTEKTAESIIRKQQFSYELNSIPISDKFWDLNPSNTLFDVYRDILNKVEVKDLLLNLQKIDSNVNPTLFLNDKDTKEYKAYQKYLALYEAKVQALSEHFLNFDEGFTDDQKKNWYDQYSILKDKSELSLAEFKVKGFKTLIDKAIDDVNEISKADEFLKYLDSVKSQFNILEKTDIITLSAIHDINFIPYDFMENESGWSNLKMNKVDLDTLYNDAKNNATNLPGEIFNIDYDESIITGIELDYSFIHLKRGWFNKEIFNSYYFLWNDPKPISDGETISNQFMLPAIPKTMILIKNLKIKLDTSVSENQVTNPDQIIYFGPLILKNQLFINKNNNEKFLKAVTNNATLKSDQLSYMQRKTASPVVEIKNMMPISKARAFESTLGDPIRPTMVRPTILARPSLVATALANKSDPVRPVATVVAPATPVAPKITSVTPVFSTMVINPKTFTTVNIPVVPTIAKVFLTLLDTTSKLGIFRGSVTVKGIRVLELETNDLGILTFDLPVGNYQIQMRADDYGILESNLKIENTAPKTVTYNLKREEINYKSFFLLGMVCEKLPRTPKF